MEPIDFTRLRNIPTLFLGYRALPLSEILFPWGWGFCVFAIHDPTGVAPPDLGKGFLITLSSQIRAFDGLKMTNGGSHSGLPVADTYWSSLPGSPRQEKRCV